MVTSGKSDTLNTVEEVLDILLPDGASSQAIGFQALRPYHQEHQERGQERQKNRQPRNHEAARCPYAEL